MDFLRSLWSGQGKSSISAEAESKLNVPDNLNPAETQQLLKEVVAAQQESLIYQDPKVVEFFKDFPEPYRQKAIERFSQRDGFYRFDIYRDMAMNNEMSNAKKGVFLEDQREYEEMIQEQKREQMKLEMQEEKELFYSRDIPPWEKKVLEVIPLQPGDRMWLKLALSANTSAFGMAFLAKWWNFQKSIPSPPRQKVVKTLIGSMGIFCSMQVVAVYRLMDWGPFDRSVDERGFLTKVVDDTKKDLKMIQSHIERKIMK
ncbi:hypothetical protein EGW08_006861 [Elysia chlorotica]|uniref:Uncharacterized protein n=1 Tax=Elysia chlorotica TaxID=188477 RepID=A0A433TUW7_ELYCH|nr:hypothetical protein EGW08_006861 [Elysia chlorotica]